MILICFQNTMILSTTLLDSSCHPELFDTPMVVKESSAKLLATCQYLGLTWTAWEQSKQVQESSQVPYKFITSYLGSACTSKKFLFKLGLLTCISLFLFFWPFSGLILFEKEAQVSQVIWKNIAKFATSRKKVCHLISRKIKQRKSSKKFILRIKLKQVYSFLQMIFRQDGHKC
jgi:hypothetical protein